jgi:hypothetical protein
LCHIKSKSDPLFSHFSLSVGGQIDEMSRSPSTPGDRAVENVWFSLPFTLFWAI